MVRVCDFCGANSGDPCRTPYGTTMEGFHLVRRSLSRSPENKEISEC
ncbi:MAG: zinc finger domain-containing protein [Thermoplasmatota archaeon]